jgi:hypothetical protein
VLLDTELRGEERHEAVAQAGGFRTAIEGCVGTASQDEQPMVTAGATDIAELIEAWRENGLPTRRAAMEVSSRSDRFLSSLMSVLVPLTRGLLG